jgi:hypothetical protein
MAFAKRNGSEILLTLTERQATFLMDVMCSISGDTERSRRRYADMIREALEGESVRNSDMRDIGPKRDEIKFHKEKPNG